MSPDSSLPFQIPQMWQAKIERLATERNQTPEAIFQEAIAQYLGEDPHRTDRRFSALEEEITTLHDRIAELNTKIKTLQQNWLQGIPDRSLSVPETELKPSHVEATRSFEEIEDEPDEILYDFLEPDV